MCEEETGPVVFDGLDCALIGFGSQCTGRTLAVYSAKEIIAIFQSQGMDYEDAIAMFDYNVATLWAGPSTPLILDDQGGENVE